MTPKQRGAGDRGPTRPGHLSNRSASTGRGGQPHKPRNGCGPFVLAILGLGVATVLQGSYMAYSLFSLAT